MPRSIIALSGALLLSGCASTSTDSTEWRQTPAWAQQRITSSWWEAYNDTGLNRDITTALANNPDLATVAARFDRADALTAKARAASLPRINLGFGYEEGRMKEHNSDPFDLGPWRSQGQLSWEIDLSGKLRAAQRAAEASRNAAFWDVHAARLQLITRIASTRFQIYLFNREIEIVRESADASAKAISNVKSQVDSGILPATILRRQEADYERFLRQQIELERLRELAQLQLRTLIGGNQPAPADRSNFPAVDNPGKLPLDQVLETNPKLLAAEARVRSAFELEKAAKLNLLPSFSINAGASGNALDVASRFMMWRASFGPSLDLPVYDPERLAQIKINRAEAKIAASEYQSAVLEILEEIDAAHANTLNRRRQSQAVTREVDALREARDNSRAELDAGIITQNDFLDTERRWLEAKRSQAQLQYLLLLDQLQLTKALGGR